MFIWLTAAVLNLAIASVVACVLVSGESAYRYVSSGRWLSNAAARGSNLPKIITFSIFVLYLVIALYCLSEAGLFYLPSSSVVLLLVTGYYFLRASVLLFDRYINPPLPTFVLMTSYGALLVGIFQAVGLMLSFR